MQNIHKAKSILILGSVTMALLLVLSVVFAVERTTFLDNAFQIVRMTLIDHIDPMADRYVSMIVRVLPYAMLKIGAPLRLVLLSFSLAYMLFHALMYYIVAYRMKRPFLALAIPATFSIAVIHGFYWCNSELFQLSSLAVLFYAVLTQDFKRPAKLVFMTLIAGLCFFTHPLTFVLLSFVIGFEVVTRKEQRNYWLFAVFVIIAHFLKSHFLPNWYDSAKTKEFVKNFECYGWEIWNVPSVQKFFEDWTVFSTPILLLAVALAMCIYLRRYLGAFALLCAFLLFFCIVHIGDVNGDYLFYIQTNRLPLSWMPIVVICRLLPELNSKWPVVILAVLMLLGMISIVNLSSTYQSRIAYIESLVEKSTPKEYMHLDEVDMSKLVMHWGMPAESLILSQLNQEQSNTTIYIAEDSTAVKQLKLEAYQACFEVYNENISFYFEIEDDQY